MVDLNDEGRLSSYSALPIWVAAASSVIVGIVCTPVAFAQELELFQASRDISQNAFQTRPFDEIPQQPVVPPIQPPSETPPPITPPEPIPVPPLEEDQLPPPEELIPQPQPDLPLEPGDIPARIRVDRFDVVGSTVFSPEELATVTNPFVGRELSFAELLQVRSAITQLYVDRGYITSGAVIPPQTIEDGVVIVQVIEGRLTEINITGTQRLNRGYIRSRLALADTEPLNVNSLLEHLQLLQLDPLIETISADLQAGVRPGTSVLQVQVAEADSFNVDLAIDNERSPSVGSFQRQIQFNQANLTGLGDGLVFSYANTDGSNELNGSYTVPLNPRNGTLQFAAGSVHSHVIEPPFDQLDIEAESSYYELTFRQPVFQSPTEEFALGLVASHQTSATELLDKPYQLSVGANDEGETRVSAVRFFQEWINRSSEQVVAVRSQFSLGVDALNASVNQDQPDSRFFTWRGQAQWVRLLAPDTLVFVRGDIQIADSPLVSLEQFGLGGAQTVRGYRQDLLLTDSGVFASVEARLPVLRVAEVEGVLQVTPFFDIGTTWNTDGVNPDPGTLSGLGLGLLWQQGDYLSARLDFAVPIISIETRERTWQESGIYFSIRYTPF